MDKDKLRDTLTSIEKWCKDNDISIFYGSINENSATEVSWTKTTDDDWEKYLATVSKSATKILIINIITNDIDTEEEEIVDYKKILEDEELKEYKNALKIVEITKGQVAYFKLNFIHDNVCYGYSQFSKWIDDFLTVQDAFSDNDNKQESVIQRTDRLSEDKVEELARKITANEKYLSAKNPVHRNEISVTLLKQEGVADHIDNWTIRRRIDNIYETEIRPKQEEETRKKVLELKTKGLKKVEIASKLNISSGMVNKFYYTDN